MMALWRSLATTSGYHRPPGRLTVEPEAVREVGEDPRLEVGHEHQEPVGAGSDGMPLSPPSRGARCTRRPRSMA